MGLLDFFLGPKCPKCDVRLVKRYTRKCPSGTTMNTLNLTGKAEIKGYAYYRYECPQCGYKGDEGSIPCVSNISISS